VRAGERRGHGCVLCCVHAVARPILALSCGTDSYVSQRDEQATILTSPLVSSKALDLPDASARLVSSISARSSSSKGVMAWRNLAAISTAP